MLQLKQLRAQAGEFQLHGIDLEVASGSYGGLLGPPGSGKSVLVETICGLRPATGGRAPSDSSDLSDLSDIRRTAPTSRGASA